MPILVKTVLLLAASNVFMTFAWYAHLKHLTHKPWIVAALVSWGIALFEYLLQVPANRIGHTKFSVGQLKIMQEVITLAVFVPFSVFYLQEPLKLNYLWAGFAWWGRCSSRSEGDESCGRAERRDVRVAALWPQRAWPLPRPPPALLPHHERCTRRRARRASGRGAGSRRRVRS